MRLAEIAMGHAAREMRDGELSPAEAQLTSAEAILATRAAIEREEDLLYMQLDTARRARQALDRMQYSLDYVAKNREREQALAAAAHHYRRLHDAGVQVSSFLVSMLTTEGLKP